MFRYVLGAIVMIIGVASLLLAAFYPQKTKQSIAAAPGIQDSQGLIRFLRCKLLLNGLGLGLLAFILLTGILSDAATSAIAIILVIFSFASDAYARKKFNYRAR